MLSAASSATRRAWASGTSRPLAVTRRITAGAMQRTIKSDATRVQRTSSRRVYSFTLEASQGFGWAVRKSNTAGAQAAVKEGEWGPLVRTQSSVWPLP